MSVSGRLFVAALSVLLLTTGGLPVCAQDRGGGIHGLVRDSLQAVLQDVTVEARSASMPGAATAVSDPDGGVKTTRMEIQPVSGK